MESDPRGFNKERSSVKVPKFDKQSTNTWRKPDDISAETLWINNKDEDDSLKTLNDKNQQASSQKFRQLIPNAVDSVIIL